jgi:hypothetical protein
MAGRHSRPVQHLDRLESGGGGQNLSAVPMSNVQFGDDATGRVYSWYADDLTVSKIQPGF